MNDDLPHAVKAAYQRVLSEIEIENDIREDLNDEQERVDFSSTFCAALEDFVDSLAEIPGGADEFRRRATYVRDNCAPGSLYFESRAKALQLYQGTPELEIFSDLEFTLEETRERSRDTPEFLLMLDIERRTVRKVLDSPLIQQKREERGAFVNWYRACREIHKKSFRLGVDGCMMMQLFHHYENLSKELLPRLFRYCSKYFPKTRTDYIRFAVESLVEWAKKSYANADDGYKTDHPERSAYLSSDLREFTGLSQNALSGWAKKAGVRTPGRGQRNYRYPRDDAQRVLKYIRDKCSDQAIIQNCKEALKEHFEITS